MTTPTIDLDRYSPVPLYHQMATQIEAAIRSGELEPGDRLPNEIELAEQLQVSRPTLRRAIEELVRRGLLVRKRGFGTQVVQPRNERRGELSSLFDSLKTRGHNPETKVLRREITPATPQVAEALRISVETPVVAIERLRLSDGEPLAVMHNWLPVDVAPFSVAELEQRGLAQFILSDKLFGISDRSFSSERFIAIRFEPFHVRRANSV
jgi:DNA-binding GntR family transcriptional regulator